VTTPSDGRLYKVLVPYNEMPAWP